MFKSLKDNIIIPIAIVVFVLLGIIAYLTIPDILMSDEIIAEIAKVEDIAKKQKCQPFFWPELKPFAKQSDIGQGQISRLLRSYPFISDGFYKSPDEYKPLSYNDLQDLLKAVSKEQKNLVKTQLPQAVFKLATTLSPLPEPPEYFDKYANKGLNFEETRTFIFHNLALSRAFMYEKEYDAALACLAASVFLTNYMTAGCDDLPEYPQFEATNVLPAFALSKVAFSNLIEFSSQLDLDSKRLREWLKVFKFLQDDYMTPEKYFKLTKANLLSFFHLKKIENDEKLNKFYRKLNSPQYLNKYIYSFTEPAISACAKSLEEAKPIFEKLHKDGKSLFSRTLDTHYFSLMAMVIFRPHEYVCWALVKTQPLVSYDFYQMILAQNRTVRAAVIVLALKTYKQESGSLPKSLSELEKWIGFEFLPDPVTGEPFLYNPESNNKILYSPASNLMKYKEDVIYLPLNLN